MNESERLSEILKFKGLNPNKLASMLGIKRSQGIYDILNGKIGISKKMADKIILLFPELNKTWLSTGYGEMLNEPEKISVKKSKIVSSEVGNNDSFAVTRLTPDNVTHAPLISQYAYAGYLSGYNDIEFMENQPIYTAVRKYSEGNYVAFEIRGDSMCYGHRPICNGDVILGRELYPDYWKSKLHIPRIFIIAHKTEGILCKEIISHDVESGEIICHSFNPEYEDIKLNLKDIIKLFYIKEQRVNW